MQTTQGNKIIKQNKWIRLQTLHEPVRSRACSKTSWNSIVPDRSSRFTRNRMTRMPNDMYKLTTKRQKHRFVITVMGMIEC